MDGEHLDPTFWIDHDEHGTALIYEMWWQRVENDNDYWQAKESHQRRDHGRKFRRLDLFCRFMGTRNAALTRLK